MEVFQLIKEKLKTIPLFGMAYELMDLESNHQWLLTSPKGRILHISIPPGRVLSTATYGVFNLIKH